MKSLEDSFLGFLKQRHRAVWTALKIAEQDNLVVIDTETDTISGVNRLLLTYPGIHEILSVLINEWAEQQYDCSKSFHQLLDSVENDSHVSCR